MGMSASQGRLLSLTARLSDLEYKAQVISNAKIRLADQSEAASTAYLDALDAEKLTVQSGVSSTGATTRIDATAYNLTTYGAISNSDKQRFIKVASTGKVIVSDKVNEAYNQTSVVQVDGEDVTIGQFKSKYPTSAAYAKENLGYSTEAEAKAANLTYDADAITASNQTYNTVVTQFLEGCGVETDTTADDYDSGAVTSYTNVLDEITESGGCYAPGDDVLKSSDWLQAQIEANNIYLYVYDTDGGTDGTGDFENVSWTSGDATLEEETDDSDTARAEAEYNATLASIQSKDKRFDLQLASINTEHTATQTEIDSVKKVIDKNIERSFKIFDA